MMAHGVNLVNPLIVTTSATCGVLIGEAMSTIKTGTNLFGALPPYLGGKRRLCPRIFREIDALVPRRHWADLTFLDAFLGGGSVSLFAKAQGFSVVSTDIAARAITIGDALIENGRVRITRE